MEHMTEKEYTATLRGIFYLFKEYSPTYSAQAQKSYYQRNKERVLERMKNKYKTDETFRQKVKTTATKWNKIYKVGMTE